MEVFQKWPLLKEEFEKPYFLELKKFLTKEHKNYKIYPKREDTFKALDLTSFEETKVVIIGQDPYHSPDTAHGLAFSSSQVKRPPSLRIIFNEISKDVLKVEDQEQYSKSFIGNDLTCWAKQGVLLLNTTLTVRQGQPGSHFGQGWEELTEAIIKEIYTKKEGVVFILWGKKAIESFYKACSPELFRSDIRYEHLILEAGHPATEFYGRGAFYGCKHFSKCNEFLSKPINWTVK